VIQQTQEDARHALQAGNALQLEPSIQSRVAEDSTQVKARAAAVSAGHSPTVIMKPQVKPSSKPNGAKTAISASEESTKDPST